MRKVNSPGEWAATSSNGYPVDTPDSVFTEATAFGEPCEAQMVAAQIHNPADAFVMAAAKDLYAVCEVFLFLTSADETVAQAMSPHKNAMDRLKQAMRKAEGNAA